MTSSMIAQTANLLVWYNAVFVTIFGVGLLFTLLQLVGLGSENDVDTGGGFEAHTDVDAHLDVNADADLDAHVDMDHDVDAHVDHDADGDVDAGPGGVSFVNAFAQLLGLGRIPLSASLMVLSYTVGLSGFLSNQLLVPAMKTPTHFFPISLLIALTIGLAVVRVLGSLMARYVPSFSTSAMEPRQLVGLAAETVLPVNDRVGLATLHDKFGTLHTVRCRTSDGAIDKGQKVVLVRYLADQNMYVIGRA